MRTVKNINKDWLFLKDCQEVPASMDLQGEMVHLPHTWNAQDGQDGGNDYYRGACYYVKELGKADEDAVYLELEGVANAASVYVNGKKAAYHEGGYSTFRVDITEQMREEHNVIAICADNLPKDNIYPQMADFTFYGGIYRDVNLITLSKSHFDLDYFGGNGVQISTRAEGNHAILDMNAYITEDKEGQTVEFIVRDADGTIVVQTSSTASKEVKAQALLMDAHLWQGVEDPYLYSLTAQLLVHNEVIDEVTTHFGVRTFTVDAQKGFFLNGKLTPLHGVSRHQDFYGIGNALTKEQHYQDMELIKEVGANTIRLAHYQHSQYFYDACDEAGMVVWAEIPFISVMNADPLAHQNCISQMTELIVQNYNHASICFWGIANEITIGGERPGLGDNLKELNALVHKLDRTRLSTIAQVSMLPMDSALNDITDIVSYNHYFGWYSGNKEQNETWLDAFHEMHPELPLGLSEYGAEGIITYHNDDPKVKDYSEDYQAIYHEHMAKIIDERPWLWATHVWNMFDFGCDARDEGGVMGRNNKGLVTLDRKIKKDSFYAYKAFWSKAPFVHLCGHRYSERSTDTTTIKVYTNQSSVELYINGVLFETKEAEKIVIFENVPLSENITMISAKSGNNYDSFSITKVKEPNPSYILIEDEDDSEGVANWFNPEDFKDVTEITVNEGYFSVKDTVGDIIANEEAGNVMSKVFSASMGIKMKKSMFGMMKDVPLETMAAMAGGQQKEEDKQKGDRMLIMLNELLNKIKK